MKLIRVLLTALIYLLFIPSSLQAKPAAEQIQHQQDTAKKVNKKRALKERKTASSVEKTPSLSAKIDLNQATVAVLSKSIRGIGVKRAEAIVNYRMKHGQFKSFEELSQIKGLGQKFVKEHLKEFEKRFTLG